MFAAMAFLMPPTGALFVAVFITIFQMRLIFGEEAFLAVQLGEPYREYLCTVPRLIPHLHTVFSRTSCSPSNSKPRWFRAVLAEINSIGVFAALAFFSWSYNNWLMIKVIVISFGISMVVRALAPPNQARV
jgi:protein-S-isoprenylcysteine O-methyltransferase Ste14